MARKSSSPVPAEFIPTPSNLEILAARVAVNPTDETLRLVYADCLDESGDPAKAMEAATIRADVAIRQVVRAKLAALEAVAAERRAERVAGLRALATQGVSQDDPAYPVCDLVARTLVIGGRKDDGFPVTEIPQPTRDMVLRAFAAGLLPSAGGPQHHPYISVGGLVLHHDASGLYSGGYELFDADYQAWTAASDYRSANKASL